MARRQVYYSFHYEKDVMRVQLIRNMGVLDGNKLVYPNEWEETKRKGTKAVQRWIDQAMRYRSCVVVLIGAETANREWVKYEIAKAWREGKAVMGVYIHQLKCPRTGTCKKGSNPFSQFKLSNSKSLASIVKCYDPDPENAYLDIKSHLAEWIEEAIGQRKKYKSSTLIHTTPKRMFTEGTPLVSNNSLIPSRLR